jgi:hypothetical protein
MPGAGGRLQQAIDRRAIAAVAGLVQGAFTVFWQNPGQVSADTGTTARDAEPRVPGLA